MTEEVIVDKGDDFIDEATKVEDTKKVEDVEDGAKADDKKDGDDKKEDTGAVKGKFVPEARVSEMARKHKDRVERYEARIKELEAGQRASAGGADVAKVEEYMDSLEEKLEEARADNNKEKAKEIRAQIRAAQAHIIDLKSSEKASAAKQETIEELKYETEIARAESAFPQLNPDSDDFDKDVADEVLEVRNGLIKDGKPPHVALARAVKYVLGEPKKGDEAKKDIRGEKAREKAVDTLKKQPENIDKHGLDSDKIGDGSKDKSIAKMSQKQFAKLDDDTLAKLRGDEL